MTSETAEQINARAALKVAVRALDRITNAHETMAHSDGVCDPYCATCIAEAARQEVAALMGV